MNIRINDLCTQLIIFFSTVMLILTGIIGIGITKYCLYVIVAFCFAKVFFMKLTAAQFVSLAMILGFSLLTVLTYSGNFASWLVFITSLFFAISLFKYGIDEDSWKFLKKCTYALCVFYVGYMFFSSEFTVFDQLILYFENPNMTGIAISVPTMLLILTIAEDGKKIDLKKIVLLAIMVYMVYLTQNRGSLIAVIVLMIASIFVLYTKKGKRIQNHLLQ